jgi:hypothetical protein
MIAGLLPGTRMIRESMTFFQRNLCLFHAQMTPDLVQAFEIVAKFGYYEGSPNSMEHTGGCRRIRSV